MNNTVPFPKQDRRDDNEQPTAPPPPAGWVRFADRAVDWAGDCIEDILDAPTFGWRGMATWLKIFIILTGTVLILWAAWWGITALIGAVRAAEWQSQGTGLIATMHQPVWDYLQTHTAELPVSATTVYAAWQLFGTASFIASWWLRATGARLTWTAWGAATTGMIWAASPATGRTIAAGLAVLTWAAASTFALCGVSLRSSSSVHVHNDVQPTPVQVRSDIHVPQPLVGRVEINGRDLRSVD
ncbi:hypothetical protein [Streptomyces sp. NBC_01643]|uniref:hypothetical protein n=1 Tax=Streptomyces sp. NBC_01643 TaxID=2975906 RepID=UPI002F90C6C2|nr:hypothetical protein OHB03_49175 [Streptomyces sp. NBC_01643]